jgi:hypothetical protein
MSERVALLSAVYGGYEGTPKRVPADLPVPAVMFTDSRDFARAAAAVGWIPAVIKPPVSFEVNPANGDPAVVRPMLEHKYWKTHPQVAMSCVGLAADVDTTIWLDGSMEINCSGQSFVDRNLAALGDDDWSAMAHPWRRCVFAEAVYSSTLVFRYDSAAMLRQHDHYLEMGHPRGWGLFATGHMVRRHTAQVAALGERWWQHNLIWSHQDQLSLPVLMRRAAELGELRHNTNLPWAGSWELHPHGA